MRLTVKDVEELVKQEIEFHQKNLLENLEDPYIDVNEVVQMKGFIRGLKHVKDNILSLRFKDARESDR
jgi:hypothetical protein